MPKQLLDAVRTAVSIHDGDYSSLRGKSFVIRDNIKKSKGRNKPVKKLEPKLTLNDLAKKIDNLGSDLRNEMNTRFDQIDSRLDYIVKANNLKDLPSEK